MRAVFLGAILILVLSLPGPDFLSFAETDVQVTDQKKITGENLEVKSENGANPAGEKKPQKAAATDGQKEVNGVDSKKSLNADTGLKKTIPTAEEDRPWLMKERSSKKSDTSPKKPVPLKWKDDAQQLQCKTQLKKLQKSLGKARTYSTRGDNCATAKHADDFLALADRLKRECPDGFLESNGYSEKINENLKVLSELGKKACLEK